MAKVISQTTQFKRDVKRMLKRNEDLARLQLVVTWLAEGKPLPAECRDHALIGEWKGFRDCHIQPDWILIYRHLPDELRLERTGTHADLF